MNSSDKSPSLSPCPDRPNCVSTLNEPDSRKMPPIHYSCAMEKARAILLEFLERTPGCEVVTVNEDYVKAVFTSKIFKFKDDVEFLFNDREKSLHFKSASRIGYYDFRVNRKRMENITNHLKTRLIK